MDNKDQIYYKFLERLRLKLIAKYDELGLRASGDYADELEAEVNPNKIIMWGASHSYYMENGRGSGKFPPISAIEDWIDTKKNLPDVFREKKKQFAFLIARKIAKEGITVPNSFNKGNVISAVVEDFLANDIHEMLEELGDVFLARIKVDIIQLFKQVA
ncbi:hypothetical protein OX284_014555 [Flavobacterium sp. SUN046]|uniref:hypothetical protein n=1 Tax=Flavobacterium sp. SUN046 TaxID=3002440 RepID=UPI002DB5BC27|nr:hypothetical protein [Flavobacterium sp. SUN046]MEC4050657.1 hypothetical protein [Flavobacterium sp. SUN046]